MTTWDEEGWDRKYIERLGADVFKFIKNDPKLIRYLSDNEYITTKMKASIGSHQLDDNSMFVLHICKFFEGVLRMIANETGWYKKFSKGKEPPIRLFFFNNRTDIEGEIGKICPQNKQRVIDKLFSTVDDFTERHNAVHYGSLIKVGEIDNYDAILTKVRDIVRVLLENGIL